MRYHEALWRCETLKLFCTENMHGSRRMVCKGK